MSTEPGYGERLYARRDVRRVAEHLAGRFHDNRAGLKSDARRQLRRALTGVLSVDLGQGALDGERCPYRALGIVLLRYRIAEEGHQPVSEPAQHMAAEGRNPFRSPIEIGIDEVAPVLRVELRGKTC